MDKIKIKDIIVKGNIRKDYGDLTELTASIKEHGVLKPVELSNSKLLVDGFRRLKAAKAAGLEEVPFFFWDTIVDKTTAQMISGIFQKNLNPIEQGNAFRKYMIDAKIDSEALAKRISKSINYVKKRLILVDLNKDVQEALIKNKIQLGHALLLAKLTKKDSSKYLREIVRDKPSVERAKGDLQYSGFSLRLYEALFDKTNCKNCKWNGSVQTELYETGTILNGTCMNAGCFDKKLKEFVKRKKEEFKEVLFKGEEQYNNPAGYTDGSQEWTCKDSGITDNYKKQCRKDKNYIVRVRNNGEITEFFKAPTKKGKPESQSSEITKSQKLVSRVNEYKKDFLIKKSIEFMQPGTKQAKILTLIKLMRSANWDEIDSGFNKVIRVGDNRSIKQIYKAKEAKIDEAISYLSRKALKLVDLKELIEISKSFKVSIKKHFVITKEFLELYTKAELMDLITEFKLFVDLKDPKVKTVSLEKLKKGELISHILNQNLKRKVPKVLK